jgi:hypothetical protein
LRGIGSSPPGGGGGRGTPAGARGEGEGCFVRFNEVQHKAIFTGVRIVNAAETELQQKGDRLNNDETHRDRQRGQLIKDLPNAIETSSIDARALLDVCLRKTPVKLADTIETTQAHIGEESDDEVSHILDSSIRETSQVVDERWWKNFPFDGCES